METILDARLTNAPMAWFRPRNAEPMSSLSSLKSVCTSDFRNLRGVLSWMCKSVTKSNGAIDSLDTYTWREKVNRSFKNKNKWNRSQQRELTSEACFCSHFYQEDRLWRGYWHAGSQAESSWTSMSKPQRWTWRVRIESENPAHKQRTKSSRCLEVSEQTLSW